MFEMLSRSWEFAKTSYGILWEHKSLLVFPVISFVAAIVVTLSFVLPLWQTGALEQWLGFLSEDGQGEASAAMYITAFLFYFCNYFAIVFCNTGLVANVFAVFNGEEVSVGYGFRFAMKRLPQICAWALVSAIVGVILKAVERSHKKSGAFVAALLGGAWTALTYFIVPVIVLDGVGPVEAFKRSVATLKRTWGTALLGNFSLGILGFLVMLPVILIAIILFVMAAAAGSAAGMVAAGVLVVILMVLWAAATSAADTIFKGLLYSHATGRSIPDNVDRSAFADAFREAR